MAKIDRLDFLEAFPGIIRDTAVPEILWDQFLAADFQRSWEAAFREYAEREAMQKLLINVAKMTVPNLLANGIEAEIRRSHLHSEEWPSLLALSRDPEGYPGRLRPPETVLREFSELYQRALSQLLTHEQIVGYINRGFSNGYDYMSDADRLKTLFRIRVAESISAKLPFDDYVRDDAHGGKPARSKIVTGTTIPFAIDNLAAGVTGIPKKK